MRPCRGAGPAVLIAGSVPAMSEPVIDAHVHVWNPEAVHYPWLTAAQPRLNRPYRVADLLPEARAEGVEMVVLVQAADNLADSEQMLDQALAHPEVAGVVVWVPLTCPDQTADQLDAWRHEPVAGVRHLVHRRWPRCATATARAGPGGATRSPTPPRSATSWPRSPGCTRRPGRAGGPST